MRKFHRENKSKEVKLKDKTQMARDIPIVIRRPFYVAPARKEKANRITRPFDAQRISEVVTGSTISRSILPRPELFARVEPDDDQVPENLVPVINVTNVTALLHYGRQQSPKGNR